METGGVGLLTDPGKGGTYKTKKREFSSKAGYLNLTRNRKEDGLGAGSADRESDEKEGT